MEAELSELAEIDSGRAFHHQVATAVDLQQQVQRRGVVARVEPPPARAAPGRVGHHDGVAGDRCQGVGTAQVHPRDVAAGHGKSHRVQVAAEQHVGGAPQGGQLRAHRTGHVVHAPAGQPSGPVVTALGQGRPAFVAAQVRDVAEAEGHPHIKKA